MQKIHPHKSIVFALSVAFLTLSCTDRDPAAESTAASPAAVTLTFTPYDIAPITRAATSISNYCTRLDLWLSDGTTTQSIHQTADGADFGTVTATLDKTKTYSLIAIAHKGTDAATLTDNVITFPDDKITHSMIYTTTFSPATTTSLTCLMTRIVAAFRMEVTDPIPDNCKKMRITVDNVFDRWNVTTGGTHSINRSTTINITSTAQDGTASFTIYNITTDDQTTHTVTAEAIDANDALLQSRTFTNVPLRNGYKTTYRGTFFIDSEMTMTFTVNDWQTYETITF